MSGNSTYSRYSLEEHEHWANAARRPDGGHQYETRPAARNYGVRLESFGDIIEVTADVRNEFEDNPDLKGAEFLQEAFVSTVESLDLGQPAPVATF